VRLAAIWSSLALVLPTVAVGGTVRGQVALLEKGGKAGDLTQVLVWVEGPKVVPKDPPTATIRMKGKAFVPSLAVVRLGGTVEFPNLDPILHNVFSVTSGNRFDLDLYKKPGSRTWTPRAAGVVRVYCNIHPQMSAIVVVRDNPYWTFAAPDGLFTIPDVPEGQWLVRAWHERGGEGSARVTVGADSSTSVALTLDASRYKRKKHTNKYGKDYDDKY
jgi:plastocyanin